jgi:hypothetical protein
MKNLIKSKIKTNWLYISIIIFVISFIIWGVLNHQRWVPKNVGKEQITHSTCLSDNEIADFDYDVDLYNNTGIKLPINSTTTIYIKNKDTGQEIFKFLISNVQTGSPSIEVHKCGVYVIRNFDLDEKKGLYKRHELWRYTYDGNSTVILPNDVFLKLYSLNFKVDPTDTFLALQKFYPGHPEAAIVIKNLNSPQLEDVLIISPNDILRKLPQLSKERYIFDVVGWSSDGKYLWGVSQGTTDTVYFRINIIDKHKENLEVFVMPKDAIHYGPPRVDTGYIWYIYGPSWVGIHEIQEQIYEEWRKENKKKILYLYNLFTKEKIKLAEVDDPAWNFGPRWLSDNELRYQLPSGETKIYKIK